MEKFEIKSTQALIRDFNGRIVEQAVQEGQPVVGASGQTKLYNLGNGCGLFLSDDEVSKK